MLIIIKWTMFHSYVKSPHGMSSVLYSFCSSSRHNRDVVPQVGNFLIACLPPLMFANWGFNTCWVFVGTNCLCLFCAMSLPETKVRQSTKIVPNVWKVPKRCLLISSHPLFILNTILRSQKCPFIPCIHNGLWWVLDLSCFIRSPYYPIIYTI